MTAANISKSRSGLGQLWGLLDDTASTTGTTVPPQEEERDDITAASVGSSSIASDKQETSDSQTDSAKLTSLALTSTSPTPENGVVTDPSSSFSSMSISSIQRLAELADAASDDDLPAASLGDTGDAQIKQVQSTSSTAGTSDGNTTTLAAFAAPEPAATQSVTTEAALTADSFDPSIVQVIDTTKWPIPSPNPAGMAWIPGATPGTGQLLVSDSEVDESPFFAQNNLFFLSETGAFDHAASLRAFCSEPTGVTYNPLNKHLFISDDSARRVFEVDPAKPDVLVSSFSARAIELDDVEDIVFDPVTGHLLLSEGEQSTLHPRTIVEVTTTGTVINRIQMPLAVGDPEGFTYDPARNVFYVCGHRSDDILVLSRDGQTVLDRLTLLDNVRNQTSGVGVKPKGLVLAPSSDPNDDPSNMSLWVADYATDQFMDGQLFEIQLAPPTSQQPPLFTSASDSVNFNTVTAGSYQAGSQYNALGGNDTVTLPTSAAAATAAGYDPAQIFHGGDGNDNVTGGGLADQINGDAGTDTLNGAGGNDTLRGGDANDTLIGGSGTDQLFGDAGHDTLKWDSADSFDGGAGFDTLDANLATSDTIDLRGSGFTNLERILTGDGTDNVTVSLSKILAQTADRQFVADLGAGTDTLNIDLAGGWTATTTNSTLGPTAVAAGISVAGMTARTFTNGTTTVTVFSNAETVQFLSTPPATGLFTTADDIVNFNQVAAGSYPAGSQYNALAGNDTVTLPVDAAAATAAGFDPTQIFHGGTGNDIVNGGKLDDQVAGDDGDDTLNGGEGNDTLDGGGWQDRLSGGDGNDTLLGGGSGDTLIGGLGDDHMDGGSSVDKVDYSAAAAVTVNLLAGTATGDGNDTLANIENVVGSAFNDSITGNTAANGLEGGNGNDVLHGGDGNDTLTGGAGLDQLFGDAGHDVLKWDSADSFDGGVGFDTLDANRSTSDTIDLRATNYTNMERILTGSGNDTVTLSLNDVLSDTNDNQFVADLGTGTDRLNIDLSGGWTATTTNSTLGPTGVAAGVSVAGLTAHTFTNGVDSVTVFTNAETVNAQQLA